MRRPSQLDLVKRVVHDRSVRAQRDSAHQLRQLEQSKAQLHQLQTFREEYSNRFTALGSGGIDGTQIREFQEFLSRLNQAIDLQKQAIKNSNNNWQECQRRWQRMRVEEESINTIVSARERERQILADREEQKGSDAGAQLAKVSGGSRGN